MTCFGSQIICFWITCNGLVVQYGGYVIANDSAGTSYSMRKWPCNALQFVWEFVFSIIKGLCLASCSKFCILLLFFGGILQTRFVLNADH